MPGSTTNPRFSPKEGIIVLENFDFQWEHEAVDKVVACWKDGRSLVDIANYIKRDATEVLLLLIHLADLSTIKPREGYLWGINNKM